VANPKASLNHPSVKRSEISLSHCVPATQSLDRNAMWHHRPGEEDGRQQGRTSLQEPYSPCHGSPLLYASPHSGYAGKHEQGSYSKIHRQGHGLTVTGAHNQGACFRCFFALRVISNLEQMLQVVSRPTCRHGLETRYPGSLGRLAENSCVFSWACTSKNFFHG